MLILPLSPSAIVIDPELLPELVLRIRSPAPLVVIVAVVAESPNRNVSMSTFRLPVPVVVIVMSALVVPADIVVPANVKSPTIPDAIVVKLNCPAPLVVNTCPVVPSACGQFNPSNTMEPVPLGVIEILALAP